MMEEQQGYNKKHIRVCILGGEKVGKTHLAHRLAGKDYAEYVQTRECHTLTKEGEERDEDVLYYDFPPFNETMPQQLSSGSLSSGSTFDSMICIFKDSTSFGQLYEFLQAITTHADANNNQQDTTTSSYWQGVKLVVLVYSNYEEKGKVQIEELFGILSEQIRNFNQSAIIKEFVLRKEGENSAQLREMIQGRRYELIVDRQGPKPDEEGQLKERLKLARSKRLSHMKDNPMVKSRDFSKSFNVEEPQQERNEQQVNHQYVEITEIKQQEKKQPHQQQRQVVQPAHQEKQALQIPNVVVSHPIQPSQEETRIHNQNEQPSQIRAQHDQNEISLNIQEPVHNPPPGVEPQHPMHSSKQQENYANITNKLLQIINNRYLPPADKAPYQDLFDQIRRNSEDDGKISSEMHAYWMERLNKIQQQQSKLQEQDILQKRAIEQQHAPAQNEMEQIAGGQQEKHSNPQSKRLPPASNISSAQRPRREKQAKPDSKSCACTIM